MKKFTFSLTLLVLLAVIGHGSAAIAQDSTGKAGALTVPWDEFKALLNLEEDQLVMPIETFQKLLAQTGVKTAPPHTLVGGNVILTREEFANLVNRMKPPVQVMGALPFEYLVTKSNYYGKVGDGGTTFTGNFVVHVLKKNAYLKIPLLPSGMALEDITVDGSPSLVVTDNGYHSIVLSETGEHDVSVSFSVRSAQQSGPNKVDLNILPTPITVLKLEIPLTGIDVEIPQAQKVTATSDDNTTTVRAVLAQARSISVRWREDTGPIEKIPPKIYAELQHLVSIEDDALKVNTDVNLNILYSEINEVTFAIPDGTNVLSVTGEGVGEWQEAIVDGERRIIVPFTYGKKGNVVVRVLAESPLSETGLANAFAGIRVLESERETGFVGIELNTSAEVIVAESAGLEPVAAQKLPGQLVNKSTKPLMLGFKYLKHPYQLVLDIKKHRKVAVPVATISSANVVTLFTEDGKVVHRCVYHVRNNAKQFLEVALPSNADVWSVFVDGKPVESSINDDDRLLIPLIRSRADNANLGTFPVELIYCLVDDGFTWLGSRQSNLPSVDLLVSQLMWSVYLPDDYAYHHFGSSLEIEEMIRGINILPKDGRRYNESRMREILGAGLGDIDADAMKKIERAYEGKEHMSRFSTTPMPEEQIVNQLNAELEFGGRLDELSKRDAPASIVTATGVLPIQIRVPTGGQVYRFAKTIIRPDDPLLMDVTYSRSWVPSTFKWLLISLLLIVLYAIRKSFIKPCQWTMSQLESIVVLTKANRDGIEKVARSPMTPIVLFGLLAVSLTISLAASVFMLFLLWIIGSFQILEYLRRKSRAKAAAATPAKK
jgi:hypothetical protein